MRLSSRAIVTSLAACALAVGWIGASGASARPASSEPSAAHYIVVLHDNVDPDAVARDHGRRFGAQVERVYHNALKGYVATFKGTGAADVAQDPRVDFVELDQKVTVQTTSPQTIDDNTGPWGLDRIDDKTGLDGSFGWTADGSGVTAYIIDTGIQTTHTEFGGRATVGTDTIGDGNNGQDCDGHGTHVAGTVGGATYGVAKNVSLVSVRVLDCTGSGSWSGVIAGIDWVAQNHPAKAVANMSLGGPASTAVDTAVANAIKAGVTFAVAAGNGNQGGIGQDACKYSPARVPTALTVGATDRTDTKSSWSNYGKCVDWFAPGVGILSAYGHTGSSDTATATMSGTSMATPHTTGVVALYLSSVLPGNATLPATVQSTLSGLTSKGVVKSAGKGTVNPNLLFTNF
jgi:subtilisin family serine protease